MRAAARLAPGRQLDAQRGLAPPSSSTLGVPPTPDRPRAGTRAPRLIERAAGWLVVLVGLSLGFDRVDPSLGLTRDLRLTNLRLAACLAIVVWLAARLAARRWPRTPRQVAVPVLTWLTALLASAYVAPTYQTQALAFVRDIAFGVLLGWLTYDLVSTFARQRAVLLAVAASGVGVAVLGVGEAARLGPLVEWLGGFRYQSFSFVELQRVSSTLPHPNIAAMMLELTLPLVVVWTATVHAPWARAALGLALAAGLACLALTLSRSGVGVLLLSLSVLAACGVWRHQRSLVVASLAAVAGLGLLVVAAVATNPLLALHLTSEASADLYRASYQPPSTATARPGQLIVVPVQVANTGLRSWRSTAEHPFSLSYHLYRLDQTPVSYDGARTRMPADVPPGATVALDATVAAPVQPGTYVVEWDGVQESATWFSWTGVPSGTTELTVTGQAISHAQPTLTPPPAPAATQPTPSRLQLWRIALRMARHLPLLGVGPDNFRWVYGDFAQVGTWDTGIHANNLYLEWLADTGVLGLGAFVWFMWRLGRTLAAALRRAPSTAAQNTAWLWLLALAVALLGWFVHGLTDYFYEPLSTNLAFWLMVGLALAAADPRRRTASET
jgi:O-antigen ligase